MKDSLRQRSLGSWECALDLGRDLHGICVRGTKANSPLVWFDSFTTNGKNGA